MKIVKSILKALLILILVLVLFVAAVLVWLTAVEYRPSDKESVAVETLSGKALQIAPGDSIRILSWNLGFGALGR